MNSADLHTRLAGRYGLTCRPMAEAQLVRAAEALARRLDVPLTELLERADRDPELARTLVGPLTVDETYFLRQPEHFELILDRVNRSPTTTIGRPITIWSAGCAHGEEPYSIAILVTERASWARPFVQIVASDLSLESIQQARQGRFSDWSMRDVPEWFRGRYFRRADGYWQIDAALRSLVRFEHLSILEHQPQLADRSVDVILFRNVAIYLEPETLERAYQGFARILADDGLLIIGPSDPPPPRQLFHLSSERSGSAYRRPPAGEPVPEPVRPARPATVAGPQPTVRPAPAPPAVPPVVPTVAPTAPALPAFTAFAAVAAMPAPVAQPAPRARPAAPPSVGAVSGARQRPPEQRALYDRAVELGNQGAAAAALEQAGKVIAAAPDWSAGYVLRATLLLAASRHREALSDLRHAGYLAPEELLPRFLRASTLRAARLGDQARSEARELVARLRQLPRTALLEDGHTTVAELLGAALELAEEKP